MIMEETYERTLQELKIAPFFRLSNYKLPLLEPSLHQ